MKKYKYPRFFQTSLDIVFIKKKGGKIFIKCPDGSSIGFYQENIANQFIKRGYWEEISKAEAVLLM